MLVQLAKSVYARVSWAQLFGRSAVKRGDVHSRETTNTLSLAVLSHCRTPEIHLRLTRLIADDVRYGFSADKAPIKFTGKVNVSKSDV